MFREWKLIYEVYEEQNSREIRCLYVMHCNFSLFKNTEWRDQKISSRPIPRLFFETKIFETETFFRDQIFSRPIPRLFFETDTETFFRDQMFSRPIFILFIYLLKKFVWHHTSLDFLHTTKTYLLFCKQKFRSYGSNISIVQKYLFEIPVQCISRIRGRIAAQDQVRFTCGGALVDWLARW